MFKKGFVLLETFSFIALIVIGTTLMSSLYLMLVQLKTEATAYQKVLSTKPYIKATEEFLPGCQVVIYTQQDKLSAKELIFCRVRHDHY
jgi:hypothetical protein